MPKIKKKEYKVLKGLDDKWEWIARDKNRCLYVFTGKPVKIYGPLLYWATDGFLSFELFDEKDLFQFIQWEDEEPYNVAELIKEYKSSLIKSTPWTPNSLDFESEDMGMNDKKWLIKRVENYIPINDKTVGQVVDNILDIIHQLDEPEVLSKEWIDNNSVYASHDGVTDEYVHNDDLKNLLVPNISEMETVDITEGQIMDWLDDNDFFHHATAETVLANAVDKGELGYYGTKYSVVERPAIPKFMAEYLDFAKSDVSLMRVMELAYTRDELPKWKKEYDWISENSETFAKAWLYGYEVEKEKLYYIKFSENQYAQKFDGTKIDSILINDKAIAGKFTKEEIEKINPALMAFAVEVAE